MSEYIAMSVRCIGECCIKCPELEIDVDRYHAYCTGRQFNQNILLCKNLEKCEQLLEHLRKNSNADNEKEGV